MLFDLLYRKSVYKKGDKIDTCTKQEICSKVEWHLKVWMETCKPSLFILKRGRLYNQIEYVIKMCHILDNKVTKYSEAIDDSYD